MNEASSILTGHREPGPRNRLFQFSFIRNRKLLSALGAATSQHFAAIGCCHPFTKTMNRLATLAMGLKCAFHNFFSFSLVDPDWRELEISGRENGPGFRFSPEKVVTITAFTPGGMKGRQR